MMNELDKSSMKLCAKVELSRFLWLAARSGRPIEMWSEFIDEVWHDELKNDSYETFSVSACGTVIGHSATSGYGKISWIAEYEQLFGDLNPVWFLDRNGNERRDLAEIYQRDRQVIASWDCGPIVPTDDIARVRKAPGPTKPDDEKQKEDPAPKRD